MSMTCKDPEGFHRFSREMLHKMLDEKTEASTMMMFYNSEKNQFISIAKDSATEKDEYHDIFRQNVKQLMWNYPDLSLGKTGKFSDGRRYDTIRIPRSREGKLIIIFFEMNHLYYCGTISYSYSHSDDDAFHTLYSVLDSLKEE